MQSLKKLRWSTPIKRNSVDEQSSSVVLQETEFKGVRKYINPEVAMIHNILMEVNSDVQNEGWVWNRENHYPLTPEEDGHIYLPNNILRMDVYENHVYRTTDLVRREGKLYDKMHHTIQV